VTSPFRELLLMRFRTFWREPYAFVWPLALQVAFAVPVFLARRDADASSVIVLSGAFGGMWGVGWPLVHMRITGLLRRFAATPMPRATFLVVFVLHRMCIALLEALLVGGVVRLSMPTVLPVPLFVFVAVATVVAVTHGAIALLVISRAVNMEMALNLMNLALWPSVLCSGIFVRVPSWLESLTSFTPIGAHLALFRAIAEPAVSPLAAFEPALVLAAWTALAFGVSTRIFRWA